MLCKYFLSPGANLPSGLGRISTFVDFVVIGKKILLMEVRSKPRDGIFGAKEREITKDEEEELLADWKPVISFFRLLKISPFKKNLSVYFIIIQTKAECAKGSLNNCLINA